MDYQIPVVTQQNAKGLGRHLRADHRREQSRSSCLSCLRVTRGPSDDHCRGRRNLCVTASCCTADPATVPSVRASKGLRVGGWLRRCCRTAASAGNWAACQEMESQTFWIALHQATRSAEDSWNPPSSKMLHGWQAKIFAADPFVPQRFLENLKASWPLLRECTFPELRWQCVGHAILRKMDLAGRKLLSVGSHCRLELLHEAVERLRIFQLLARKCGLQNIQRFAKRGLIRIATADAHQHSRHALDLRLQSVLAVLFFVCMCQHVCADSKSPNTLK